MQEKGKKKKRENPQKNETKKQILKAAFPN